MRRKEEEGGEREGGGVRRVVKDKRGMYPSETELGGEHAAPVLRRVELAL